MTHSLICWLAVIAIAGEVALVTATFAAAASSLAFALPVTGVAGLGPPQAAWTAALHLTGVSWEVSIASALLVYGCLLLGVILTAAPTLLWAADQASSGRVPLPPQRSGSKVAAI